MLIDAVDQRAVEIEEKDGIAAAHVHLLSAGAIVRS